jgi:hypothetical protein
MVKEFETLVPTFQAAFLAHMDEWTLEGKPRTRRRYSLYTTCPLPKAEDRLLFLLTYCNAIKIGIRACPSLSGRNAFPMTVPKA